MSSVIYYATMWQKSWSTAEERALATRLNNWHESEDLTNYVEMHRIRHSLAVALSFELNITTADVIWKLRSIKTRYEAFI